MVMQNQIYTELVNDTQARAPEWARRDSDPVDSALQANATVMTKALTFFNGRERAAFLSTATGADLDAHGIAVGVIRTPAELDDTYRQRIIDARNVLRPVGSIAGIESFSRQASKEVAQAVAQPNYTAGTTSVYLLETVDEGPTGVTSGLPGTPTPATVQAVQAYLNDDRRHLASQRITVATTTDHIREYAISFTATYNEVVNPNYETQAQEVVYKWIDDNRRMGNPIRKVLLTGAIVAIPGTINVVIPIPTSDELIPFPTNPTAAQTLTNQRTAYSCYKRESGASPTTGVNFNFVRLRA